MTSVPPGASAAAERAEQLGPLAAAHPLHRPAQDDATQAGGGDRTQVLGHVLAAQVEHAELGHVDELGAGIDAVGVAAGGD